jgi:hypothetical protein
LANASRRSSGVDADGRPAGWEMEVAIWSCIKIATSDNWSNHECRIGSSQIGRQKAVMWMNGTALQSGRSLSDCLAVGSMGTPVLIVVEQQVIDALAQPARSDAATRLLRRRPATGRRRSAISGTARCRPVALPTSH